MRATLPKLLLFACAYALVTSAHGQAVNNDYYSSRGTGLLDTVERYHLGPGEEKMRARHYQAAFGDFRFILNYFPNHPQALLLMAQLCEAWKSPTCVPKEYFDAALARNPSASATYVAYGIYLLRARQVGGAIAEFNRAIELAPDSINAHYNIGLAYLDIREYDLANEHAQKAYALGATLPGLRDRLKRENHWKPTDPVPPVAAPERGETRTAPRATPGS